MNCKGSKESRSCNYSVKLTAVMKAEVDAMPAEHKRKLPDDVTAAIHYRIYLSKYRKPPRPIKS